MYARSRQILASGFFALDAVLLYGSWMGAYWLRFHVLGLPAPLGVPPLSLYLWSGAVLTPVALLILRTLRVYRSARTARLSLEIYHIVVALLLTASLAGVGSFYFRRELSRSTVLIFLALGTTVMGASRLALRLVLRLLRRMGRNLRHVLIVGTGDLARLLIGKIRAHDDFGLRIEGMVTAHADEVGAEVEGHEVVGVVSDLQRLVEQHHAEIVYLALARPEYEAEHEALVRLADSTAAVRLVPDLTTAFRLNANVEDFDGMPVVLVTETPEQGWNALLKRLFDLLVSGVALIVLSPVLAVIAILVKLDSPGPVLYRQERVGMSGRRFRMLKFRSMRADAERHGPGWSTPDDPRRTRLGETLRRLSLDELPQLWNVLVGEMSLVGPRPEQPVYVERFREAIPRYMLRHHMKAGMTGWAQVNGLRGDTPLERRIEYDLHYIQNWSLAFDLRILLLTAARVFRDASAH